MLTKRCDLKNARFFVFYYDIKGRFFQVLFIRHRRFYIFSTGRQGMFVSSYPGLLTTCGNPIKIDDSAEGSERYETDFLERERFARVHDQGI